MIERYAVMIETSLEIRQHQIEISNLHNKLKELMTVKELNRDFSEKAAHQAFKLLPSTVHINKASYVKGILTYKDVEVYLHEEVNDLGTRAMKECLSNISNRNLIN